MDHLQTCSSPGTGWEDPTVRCWDSPSPRSERSRASYHYQLQWTIGEEENVPWSTYVHYLSFLNSLPPQRGTKDSLITYTFGVSNNVPIILIYSFLTQLAVNLPFFLICRPQTAVLHNFSDTRGHREINVAMWYCNKLTCSSWQRGRSSSNITWLSRVQ